MAALSGQRSRQGLLCSLENQLGPVELLFVWRTESWGREPREQLAVWARVFGVCRTSLAQSAAIDRLRLELQGAPQAPGTLTLRPLADVERETILLALQQTGGRIHGARGAAQLLGLHPNTLRSRMKKHGLGGARDHRPSRA